MKEMTTSRVCTYQTLRLECQVQDTHDLCVQGRANLTMRCDAAAHRNSTTAAGKKEINMSIRSFHAERSGFVKRYGTMLMLVGLMGLLAMPGCASIIAGSTQTVAFKSNPSGARIKVISHKGEVIHEGTTPFTASLKRGRGFFQGADMKLAAEKAGYKVVEQPIKTSLEPWYIGNVIFGGLVGLLVVDPLTGAMFKLPNEVHVNLNPSAAASVDSPTRFDIVSLDDIPQEARSQLVRIN